MTRRLLTGAALAAALVVLTGCSKPDFPPLYPVAGKIGFEDGKPLAVGVLDFESETSPPWRGTGRVSPDGEILDVVSVLPNGKSGPGLVAGTHKVCVSLSLTAVRADGRSPIPERYTDWATTDLRITVAPPKADVTLTLKPGRK